MILALDALYPESPALGRYYLITDEEPQLLWHILDRAVVRFGGVSLYDKLKVPTPVMYALAYVSKVVSFFTGWASVITPFNVTMLTIDRYFNIDEAKRDLKYKPLKSFDQGWEETLQWFKSNPEFSTICAQSTVRGQLPQANKSQ
jgi:nucleoside-diphosphate-sugar epimerase